MRRRNFVALLGSAVVPLILHPLAARAQPARMPTIGFLVAGDPDPALFLKVFRDSLRDLGYFEGQNVRLEIRSAVGKPELLPELAAELVRRKVDIIVAWQTPTVRAAKQATTEIPIVMVSGDPVGMGLIASLAKPGGNVTGMSGVAAELAGKSVELIREMLPSARQLAALCNADDPFSETFLDHVRLGARGAAMELEVIMVRGGGELEASFPRMREQGVHAVIVQPSLPIGRAAELALKANLPAFSVPRSFAAAGGLMAYTGRAEDQFRQVATYVDKILRGAKPGDLPVEQPSRFDLIVNLKTAKLLGLTIPPLLLARADEIIE
jgi:putative ABC transport system substrate-binding protein